MPVSDAVKHVAAQFNKSLDYTEACIRVHAIKLPLPPVRSPNDGLNGFYSDMTAHFDLSPSLTKQEFVAECDINNILRKYVASGYDPSVLQFTKRQGQYGDFTSMPDSYHAALNYITDTRDMFMTLDAELRARFENDPQKFIDFVSDPANAAELVKLGLATSKPLETSPDPSGAEDVSKGKGAKRPVPSANAIKAAKNAANADLEGDEGDD